MPDKKGNLFLFEAIELRNEYDRHIKLLQELIGESSAKEDRFFSKRDNDEQKEPASDFNQKELEARLKKLQTKRVKLNQEIQIANFKTQIDFNGEKISVAESLELRKSLLADKEAVSQRVSNSAYKRIIHKEERDIIHEPKHSFKKSYAEFQENLKKIRTLVNQIHIVNYHTMVNFRDE
ncbi:MAG: hypothetical protein ABII25_09645 [bacterium]